MTRKYSDIVSETPEEYAAKHKVHYDETVVGPLKRAQTEEEADAVTRPLYDWIEEHELEYVNWELERGRAGKFVKAGIKQLQAIVSSGFGTDHSH